MYPVSTSREGGLDACKKLNSLSGRAEVRENIGLSRSNRHQSRAGDVAPTPPQRDPLKIATVETAEQLGGRGKSKLMTRGILHDFVEQNQEVGALGATIKKRREELQEVTHTNAVEMDSIKTKAAEAVAKAKEDHEKKVRQSNAAVCSVRASHAPSRVVCFRT